MKRKHFVFLTYLAMTFALIIVMLLCICVGSVKISFIETISMIWNTLLGQSILPSTTKSIIVNVRLPRILCVTLSGAALSFCGAAMQCILKNPLADGSTMGVSSGAALGAVLAMATGFTLPGSNYGGIMIAAMLFAFGSLILILSLAYVLDQSLNTNNIILIGVVFSMFISSIISVVITFASDHTRSLSFWTLGSFSGVNYDQAKLLFFALVGCGGTIIHYSTELNAFAISEENALHIGVNIKKIKLIILIMVSILIGVCVSISGTVSFVGLVMPHIARMVVGPNHKRLLPASLFSGAIFLLLADLVARTLLSPIELSIGVVTSFIGAIGFVVIFYQTRRTRK